MHYPLTLTPSHYPQVMTPSSPGKRTTSPPVQADNTHSFMHYALSLMRSHSNEHSDHILPPINPNTYRHIAYTLDAFVYYIRKFV